MDGLSDETLEKLLRPILEQLLELDERLLGPQQNIFRLEPARTGAERTSKHHPRRSRFCGTLPRLPLGSAFWIAFTLPVGYENWKSGGRRRCQEGQSYAFVSTIQFDLSGLPTDRRLESAIFSFSMFRPVISTTYSDPDTGELREISLRNNTCERHPRGLQAIVLNRAPWPEGKRDVENHTFLTDGTLPRDAIHEMRYNEALSLYEVDVSRWVQWWLEGRFENHGIAFVGWDHSLRKANDTCVVVIEPRSVELRLRFSE